MMEGPVGALWGSLHRPAFHWNITVEKYVRKTLCGKITRVPCMLFFGGGSTWISAVLTEIHELDRLSEPWPHRTESCTLVLEALWEANKFPSWKQRSTILVSGGRLRVWECTCLTSEKPRRKLLKISNTIGWLECFWNAQMSWTRAAVFNFDSTFHPAFNLCR